MTEPRPPENVRIIMLDGSVTPVQFVYEGWDAEERLHIWVAVDGTPEVVAGMHVMCDSLPARTSLIMPIGPGVKPGEVWCD